VKGNVIYFLCGRDGGDCPEAKNNRSSRPMDAFGDAYALTCLLVFTAASARADQAAKPSNRAEATGIIANARKVVTPDGVERLEKVRIGGIDQWVSIRGTDRRNPGLGRIYHCRPVGPARPRGKRIYSRTPLRSRQRSCLSA
jgi:hypothetical protein